MLLLCAIVLLAACGQRSSDNLEVDMDNVEVGELQISSETMEDIIYAKTGLRDLEQLKAEG